MSGHAQSVIQGSDFKVANGAHTMRRGRWRQCLLSWLVFSFPFLAFTSPAWLSIQWLAAILCIIGLLFVVWLDVGYVFELVRRIKRHRRRELPRAISKAEGGSSPGSNSA